MTPKFRASYSILNVWDSGDWERAIKYYFKLETYTSPAMAAGKEWHKNWSDYINATQALPIEFGGKKLFKPQSEIKRVVSIEPWLDLVGIIDCYDNPTIYEFKTGKTSSEVYASSMQAGVYAVLATYGEFYADRAEIHHYDQYTKKHDMSVVWITDKMLEKALNWIITLSSDMHDYFLKNQLYEKFGKKL